MKRIARKLKSKCGETLVEILVAVLVIALSAGLFATMFSASMSINLSAQEQDEAMYEAVGDLEDMIGSEKTEHKNGTLHYEPLGDNKNETGAQDVEVDVLTQNGLTVYTDLDKSGESEP